MASGRVPRHVDAAEIPHLEVAVVECNASGMTSLIVRDGVGTITIDNPAARNALDDATRKALLRSLREAMEDPACAAVVLVGAGGTFCAGGDLASMPTEEEPIRRRLGEMHDIVRLLHAGPKPTVSAVDGAAFGSGFSLAVACDRVIATEGARFGCSFGKVGLIADTGLIWTLPHRVGDRTARRILLEGQTIGAVEAHRIGVVDELTDNNVARAEEWASAFAGAATLALAATKRLLASSGTSLDELLAAEVDAQVGLLASADFAEGRRAFFGRRPPVFGAGA